MPSIRRTRRRLRRARLADVLAYCEPPVEPVNVTRARAVIERMPSTEQRRRAAWS